MRGLFNRVRSSKRRKNQPQRVKDYVRQARRIAERAQESLEELPGARADAGVLSEIQYLLDHAERLGKWNRQAARRQGCASGAKGLRTRLRNRRWDGRPRQNRPRNGTGRPNSN